MSNWLLFLAAIGVSFSLYALSLWIDRKGQAAKDAAMLARLSKLSQRGHLVSEAQSRGIFQTVKGEPSPRGPERLP